MNARLAPLLSLVFSFCSIMAFAQKPIIQWQKLLGGKNGEYARKIQVTTDGGYIVIGDTEGPDNGDIVGYHGNQYIGDIWITKLDATGTIQWKRTLGGTFMETSGGIHQTTDGGYIVAGSSASSGDDAIAGKGGLDFWILKLDANGKTVWQKKYGGSKNEYATSVSASADGGFIIGGYTQSVDGDVTGFRGGGWDAWVIKINSTGTLLWQKCMGGSNIDRSFEAVATADGGAVMAGHTESVDGDVAGNHGSSDYWIVKLDGSGTVQWKKCYGGSGYEQAWSVKLTTDGGYIFTGSAASSDGDVSGNHGASDFWVVKTDALGTIQWQKCYGGSWNEIAYSIENTPDGGYLVCGSSESSDGDVDCNRGITDMWVIKINSAGNIEWKKSMGGTSFDHATSIHPTSDGGAIIAGHTCSPEIPGYHLHNTVQGTCSDYWIVKLSPPLPQPPPPVITIDKASATVCQGAKATLTATVTNAGLSPVYQWKKNGIAVGANLPYYTAADFVNGDIITCTVVYGDACDVPSGQATDAVTINVINNSPLPQVTIAAIGSNVCGAIAAEYRAYVRNQGPSPFYQWKVNNADAGNGTSTFISNSLKAGDVITCIYWDNTTCISGGIVVSNNIQVQPPGAQTVPMGTVFINSPVTCEGSPLSFSVIAVNAGANPTYQWKVNDNNAGGNSATFTSSTLKNGDMVNCTITVDPAYPCSVSPTAVSNAIPVNITPLRGPEIKITSSQAVLCAGSMATITAAVQYAGANPSYQWMLNGVNAGQNKSTFSSTSFTDGDVITCRVTADPALQCPGAVTTAVSYPLTLSVIQVLPPSITITASANEFCKGDNIVFTADVRNAGTSPMYTWKINNTTAGSSASTFRSATLKNADIITCEITPQANSCSDQPVSSNAIPVIVHNLPVVSIVPADTLIAAGSKLQLHATVSGGYSSFTWSPASKLESSATLTPWTISLTDNTTYNVQVSNDKNCKATASATVEIIRNFYMPNAFTPNGDGNNDIFRIPANTLLSLTEFSIFDRWGNKVFITKDPMKGWDGTRNGIILASGNYVYFIKGKDNKGDVVAKGNVVLIR